MTIAIRHLRYLLAVILLVSLAPAFRARAASARAVCYALPGIQWREARTSSFAILYTAEYQSLGQRLAELYGESLDEELARFEALFETSLSTPISIRIYPTPDAYDCLNAQPPDIRPWTVHSHVGSREIALIGSNLSAGSGFWSYDFINIFRYELGALFAGQTAGEEVPPGLLAAIGHYAQDPAQTVGLLQLDWKEWLEPTQNWGSLWEEAETRHDLGRQLEATSTVAYLVDTYGWEPFLKFLKSLPASQSFRQSLSQAYSIDLPQLEEEWRAYYPRYFRELWQSHVIYNYNLDPVKELIQAENYVEADRELQEAIAFLEKINRPVRLEQARSLLQVARLGHEADSLMALSRQSFYSGDYQRSLEVLVQAEQKYAQVGNYYRLDELNAYYDQVQQVLALHEEIARLQGQVGAQWNTLSLASRLVSLGRSLSDLGDTQGHARVREMAVMVEARQREQHAVLSLAALAVVLFLLGVRIWLLRLRPSPEAQL